jgi:hypothetical protein
MTSYNKDNDDNSKLVKCSNCRLEYIRSDKVALKSGALWGYVSAN